MINKVAQTFAQMSLTAFYTFIKHDGSSFSDKIAAY